MKLDSDLFACCLPPKLRPILNVLVFLVAFYMACTSNDVHCEYYNLLIVVLIKEHNISY